MENTGIYFADGEDPKMIEAYKKAQETFKYFWRELSWEYRRIVPGLDMAYVKVAFSQDAEGSSPMVEHMWINEIGFDGNMISGTLINDPNDITNVKNGDHVEIPLTQISDWLIASEGKTYGGFTIHALRSEMSKKELKQHDNAWGLNFGDFNDILVVNGQKKHPENLIEHPMSKNMKDRLIDFINENPDQLNTKDSLGYTFLHREAISGNLTSIEVLLSLGADRNATTNGGKTALDFAKELNWEHIIPVLEK